MADGAKNKLLDLFQGPTFPGLIDGSDITQGDIGSLGTVVEQGLEDLHADTDLVGDTGECPAQVMAGRSSAYRGAPLALPALASLLWSSEYRAYFSTYAAGLALNYTA